MVDMSRDTSEQPPMLTMPEQTYPHGLCICLTHEELGKLGLDADCEVGDLLHMVSMAKVTNISKGDSPTGPTCRIEMQLIDIEVLEDENEEYEERPKMNPDKFYKG